MFELLVDTPAILERMLAEISDAKQSIKVQFMTFEADKVGLPFAEALEQKSRQGLRVEVLIDTYTDLILSDKQVIGLHTPRVTLSLLKELYATKKMIGSMRKSGIDTQRTNPVNILRLSKSLYERDHRKILVIDDRLAFIGGFNLSEHNYSWYDTCVVLDEPELVSATAKVFEDKKDKDFTAQQPIEVGSHSMLSRNEQVMAELKTRARNANHRIYLESPYIEDHEVFSILAKKKAEGVDALIIVPSANNKPRIAELHRKYAAEFKDLVCFRQQPKPMTHTKLALVDNEVFFGSANFTTYYDVSELMIMTSDEGLRAQVANFFKKGRTESDRST